jgi:ectoine hydroxylase-related dioxygenase (phytanoyl-CoA dioxygenase family)
MHHPVWNQAMEPKIDLASFVADGSPGASELIQKAAQLFRVHGGLVLQNVFPADLIAEMRKEFENSYESLPLDEIQDHCLEVGNKRYKFTVNVQHPFNNPALYAAPKLIPILEQILAPDMVIHSFGAVCAFPGSEMQHFHQDHGPLYAEAGALNAFLPPYCLRVHLPMLDLSEKTGSTAMWLGSHRERSNKETTKLGNRVGDGIDGAYMPYPQIGDCYLMDFRLSHRGTPNESDQARTMMYMLYSRRWFKDHKNFDKQSRLDVTAEEYEKIPEEQRHLFLNAKLDNH